MKPTTSELIQARAAAEFAESCRNPTLDDRLRTAVEKDFEQYFIDSLTPHRGYLTPIDNVKALFLELMHKEQAADVKERDSYD